jgi:hypothetical protein
LFFDHFQEVTVIDNALKYRTQGESIMATEGGGESNDRDDMRKFGWFELRIRVGNPSAKVG